MLVQILATFAPAPWVVKPAAVVNVSQIGSPVIHGKLRTTRVVNQSSFGTPVVRVSKRYLLATTVSNVSTIPNKTVRKTSQLTQTRVVNTSQFGGHAIVNTKRYLTQTRVTNTSLFGSNVVQSAAPPSSFVPGDSEPMLVNDAAGAGTTPAGAALLDS